MNVRNKRINEITQRVFSLIRKPPTRTDPAGNEELLQIGRECFGLNYLPDGYVDESSKQIAEKSRDEDWM